MGFCGGAPPNLDIDLKEARRGVVVQAGDEMTYGRGERYGVAHSDPLSLVEVELSERGLPYLRFGDAKRFVERYVQGVEGLERTPSLPVERVASLLTGLGYAPVTENTDFRRLLDETWFRKD